MCRAVFHTGSVIEKFNRLKMSTTNKEVKHFVVFGTLGGGIGVVSPVDELVYRRLISLQSRMVTSLSHTSGLNPKGFRYYKGIGEKYKNLQNNILDGLLINKYLYLEFAEQRKLSKQIGTTVEVILDNIN